MGFSLSDRLLRREIQDPYRYSTSKDARGATGANTVRSALVREVYGDKRWIGDLDIVNELGGHTGCVNALSWSKSGRLLASGSDDKHLNIHTYQPENSTAPFTLTTTISTGHLANIFSVKFMPHSNDQTLVSCAGDSQVRVFDVEHSSKSSGGQIASVSSARHHSGVDLEQLYRGVQLLGPTSTNARIYRSHGDRAKRIVTESSPHLFLTCSEDGEVRQWDLRLPSSAYPSPHARNGGTQVPPPLISYKRFRLDLNTISCSGSQPHYIVLGGAHLHAFLHDRRMLGRDVDAERGREPLASNDGSQSTDDSINKATRCVRRFAPNGKKKMARTDSGHITACKISDANPNELIASWSGDHIYSFNIIASPDAHEANEEKVSVLASSNKATNVSSAGKKRKRQRRSGADHSTGSLEGVERGSARSRSAQVDNREGDVALRVRYGNGQSEDIPLEAATMTLEQHRASLLSEAQRQSTHVGKAISKIRQLLFSPENAGHSVVESVSGFEEVYEQACVLLPEMERISSTWAYPVLPDADTLNMQNTMRRNRAISCRFIQAAGTLARVITNVASNNSNSAARFLSIDGALQPAAGPRPIYGSNYQKFCYLFLGVILAWVDGGTHGLLEWFKSTATVDSHFSVQQSDTEDSIHEKVIPGLLSLANEQERAIVNVDASRFELDNSRILYSKGADAVIAFSHAIRIPLEASMSAVVPATGSTIASVGVSEPGTQHQDAARKYWALKVGRGLLLSAGEGTNYAFVNTAFGGLRIHSRADEERSQQEVDLDEPEECIESIGLSRASVNLDSQNGASRSETGEGSVGNSDEDGQTHATNPGDDFVDLLAAHDLRSALRERDLLAEYSDEDESEEHEGEPDFLIYADQEAEEVDEHDLEPNAAGSNVPAADDDDDEEDAGDEEDESDDDVEDLSEDDDDLAGLDPTAIFGHASAIGRNRESVESHVPCANHTRVYRGHCNVKTVKDVNFFGLEDEYVVSGSDSGHVFIWDKKTQALLNILQGDSDVVNVIQGHPYEPVLAVSGIDDTIKIFSPDQRAQLEARRGIKISTTHRSYDQSRVLRNGIARRQSNNNASFSHEPPAEMDWDEESLRNERPSNGGLESCRRMHDSYQITNQNDIDRQGGLDEAFFTRSMLTQFAARLRAQRRAAAGLPPQDPSNELDEDGNVIVVDNEDCTVM